MIAYRQFTEIARIHKNIIGTLLFTFRLRDVLALLAYIAFKDTIETILFDLILTYLEGRVILNEFLLLAKVVRNKLG